MITPNKFKHINSNNYKNDKIIFVIVIVSVIRVVSVIIIQQLFANKAQTIMIHFLILNEENDQRIERVDNQDLLN